MSKCTALPTGYVPCENCTLHTKHAVGTERSCRKERKHFPMHVVMRCSSRFFFHISTRRQHGKLASIGMKERERGSAISALCSLLAEGLERQAALTAQRQSFMQSKKEGRNKLYSYEKRHLIPACQRGFLFLIFKDIVNEIKSNLSLLFSSIEDKGEEEEEDRAKSCRGEKKGKKMDGASEKEEDLVGAAAAAIKERGEAGEESAN